MIKRSLVFTLLCLSVLAGCTKLVRNELLEMQDQIDSLTIAGRDGDRLVDDMGREIDSLKTVVDRLQSDAVITFSTSNGPIPDDGLLIMPNKPVNIHYTLEGGSASTLVTASSDGQYAVSVSANSDNTGVITVRCPQDCKNGYGYINILVYDGEGYVTVRVFNIVNMNIHFLDQDLEIENDPSKLAKIISNAEQTVTIPFDTANFDFSVVVDDECKSWIENVSTKAESGEIVLNVAKNLETLTRTGNVKICATNYAADDAIAPTFRTIELTQEAAVFSLATESVSLYGEGETVEVVVNSSIGVSADFGKLPEWLEATLLRENDEYRIRLAADTNVGETRDTKVNVKSIEGDESLELTVTQLSTRNPMVFVASVNIGQTVYLPLDRHFDSGLKCRIKWGDGESEDIISYKDSEEESGKSLVVSHQYKTAGTYEISVFGTVKKLSSTEIFNNDNSAIISVSKWGEMEFEQVHGAFRNFTALKSVAVPEGTTTFGNITDFSYMFNGCHSLESIPSGFFKGCSKAVDFGSLFCYCNALKSVPEGLFDDCSEARSFNACFAFCNSLANVPVSLFAVNSKATDFRYCFSGAPLVGESPYKMVGNVKVHLYEQDNSPAGEACFSSDKLSDWSVIPDNWKLK